MDWAEEDFLREIDAVKWDWPRSTKRRSGATVGSPRDIVDLGGLRDSQKRENVNEARTIFTWTGGEGESYAAEVHNGYTSKTGNRIPARPFTRDTILKLGEVISSLLSKEVKNV